jgi:hypothetical protein
MLLLAFSLASAPAIAGGVNCKKVKCAPYGGTVKETSAVPADFIVHISGPNGREIFFPGFPKPLKGVLNPKTGLWEAKVVLPNDPDAHDAWNDTLIKVAAGGPGNRNGGGAVTSRSVLNIESTLVDTNGFIRLTPIFATLYANQGTTTLYLPDFFVSDGSGQLVDGGQLYVLADLSVLFDHPLPAFAFGNVLQIQNGLSASLPGFQFSTDPFVFDYLGGTGFSAPPFSGYATILTRHELTSTPEPATWAMMVVGFAILGASLRGSAMGCKLSWPTEMGAG